MGAVSQEIENQWSNQTHDQDWQAGGRGGGGGGRQAGGNARQAAQQIQKSEQGMESRID